MADVLAVFGQLAARRLRGMAAADLAAAGIPADGPLVPCAALRRIGRRFVPDRHPSRSASSPDADDGIRSMSVAQGGPTDAGFRSPAGVAWDRWLDRPAMSRIACGRSLPVEPPTHIGWTAARFRRSARSNLPRSPMTMPRRSLLIEALAILLAARRRPTRRCPSIAVVGR